MRGEEAARGCVPASGETSSAVPFPNEGFYAPIANKNPTCNWFSCQLLSRLKSLPVRKLFCYRWQHWGLLRSCSLQASRQLTRPFNLRLQQLPPNFPAVG